MVPQSAPTGSRASGQRITAVLAIGEPGRHMSLEHILTRGGHTEIVGAAANGREAIDLTEQLQPDLVIMGVDLPVINGFVATKEIMIRCPTPVLIVGDKLTGMSAMANEGAYRAGALSYVPECPSSDDEDAVQAFLDIVARVARSEATRYWRIRQSWATDAEVQAIVLLVASASVEGLAQLVERLPEDFAAPLVVLPYVGKGFKDGFVNWLRRKCPLAVQIASEGDVLKAGMVYVAPDDRHLEIVEAGIPVLHLSPEPPVRNYRPSGVPLVSTLSRVYGPRGLAVVMEGVREDLVAAMCTIWLEGGRVFAQAPTRPTRLRWPPEEILHKMVDAMMAPAELAGSLTQMVRSKVAS
jgi:two-component system chemotaxis response regulator CheB